MIQVDNQLRKNAMFRYRENNLKALPMSKLEKKIDKFLQESGIKYHRQWIIKMGCRKRMQKRYAVSFYLPTAGIALDMVNAQTDMSLYDFTRHIELFWYYAIREYKPRLDAIIPIDEDLSFREVKKQLQIFISR